MITITNIFKNFDKYLDSKCLLRSIGLDDFKMLVGNYYIDQAIQTICKNDLNI